MEYYVLDHIESTEVKIYEGELFTATEIATSLGIKAKDLNNYLIKRGIVKRYNIHCIEVIDSIIEEEMGRYVVPSKTLLDNPLYKWNQKGVQFILNLIEEDLLK